MSIEERLKIINEDLEIFETTSLENIQFLLEQNQRLSKALELFADSGNWMGRNKLDFEGEPGIIEWDGDINPIKLAREVLEKHE